MALKAKPKVLRHSRALRMEDINGGVTTGATVVVWRYDADFWKVLTHELVHLFTGNRDEGEVEAEARVYWWHDKYRPRKPKYFNRVHTGYEWNKYNQTHYDHDNPPPKVVQGYKFNIFYPDLIDPGKAPQFSILPDGSPAGETCILRFSAGPPYEDLAFRIVNKQWEYGHKRGYKSTFERGILHLHFNFERPRYRR